MSKAMTEPASPTWAGPLAGVPMAHKDMYYREGVPSSCGSKIGPGRPATSTATVAMAATVAAVAMSSLWPMPA